MLSEHATADYLRRLNELDQAGKRIECAVGPFTAYTLIGVLQFLTRNPGVPSQSRAIARLYADAFTKLFTRTPGEESIRRGWHPEWDAGPDDEPDPDLMEWLAQIAAIEATGETTPVRIAHVDGFFLLVMLNSVTRAPGLTDATVRRIHLFADQLRPAYAGQYGEEFIRDANHERWQW